MNKVKTFIRENLALSLAVFVVIAILLTFAIIDFLKDHKIYESNLNNGNEVNYISKKYADNEYRVITMSDEDLLNRYYQYYIRNIVNHPEEAWKITYQNGENRAYNFNGDYQSFLEYTKKIITKTTSNNEIKKYKITKDTRYNIINLIDSENQMYEIYEYGIWDFKVAFKGRVND